ncbi:MAG: hypothetical protein CMD65_03095 [Gammaproteobacteria bacterium]|nr:hypothetical protein [Gammaproteobacteria bacterium]|tara:strand:- start:909 stop:1580 length:672 start_codon:yes stop_codon:yes gene_type:complete
MKKDFIFIKWLYFIIILLIFITILYKLGFIADLFISDISYISSLILILFTIFTFKVGREIYYIMNTAIKLDDISTNNYNLTSNSIKIQYSDNFFYDCVINHMSRYKLKSGINDELNKNFEFEITKPLEIGWLMSDLLLKLGLIGTVIGFIIMLNSVTLIENFDLTMMQDLLKKMSGGMKVALYTTLTGLVTSILLSMQYKYMEEKIYEIISIVNINIELYFNK